MLDSEVSMIETMIGPLNLWSIMVLGVGLALVLVFIAAAKCLYDLIKGGQG